jgi:membrane protein implicated in regulation of membrane protease activity
MDLQQLIIGGGATFLWLFVAIAAAVLESMTCDLVAIWFVPGALSAMLLSIFVPSIGWQIAVFLILSVAVLVLAKTVFKKYMPKVRKNVMNTDALIGARAVVAEEINNLHGTGSVKVNGVVWTARAVDPNATIEAGSVVIIKQIEGVKLICMPEDNTQNN